MSQELAIRPKASQQLAAAIGMDPSAMLDTFKAQCFKGGAGNVTNEQLAAFVSIAADMGVNPLLPGMLYAYPVSGGGVVPIMGPAGVYKKLAEHPEVLSWETTVFPEDVALPPTHAVTEIFRKGRDKPLKYTALLSEWKVDSNPNWRTRPRHMLSLRSLKHCAAQIIHGIPGDEDDRVIAGEVNVTPAAEPAVTRAEPPVRARKGANAAKANEAAAIEVTATTVAPEPAKTEPVPEKPAMDATAAAQQVAAPEPVTEAEVVTPSASQSRTSLADAEDFTANCTVISADKIVIRKEGVATESVTVQLEGEYTGVAYHMGGTLGKPWTNGIGVRVTLRGKLAKKANIVQVWVENVEASVATVEA